MLTIAFAGALGEDAQHRSSRDGLDICRFSVACNTGYGDNRQTIWVHCTRFGKGADRLAQMLTKGMWVAVSGEMSLFTTDSGKTIVQCRADHVTVIGRTAPREPSRRPAPADNRLDDEIPF